VPKKYVEKVGDEGFKRRRSAQALQVVSSTPGVEIVVEAFEATGASAQRQAAVFKSVPDETTRAAALKRRDADIVYFLGGPVAEDVQRTPGLKLTAVRTNTVIFLDFTEQWDPKSPCTTGGFASRRATRSTGRP